MKHTQVEDDRVCYAHKHVTHIEKLDKYNVRVHFVSGESVDMQGKYKKVIKAVFGKRD